MKPSWLTVEEARNLARVTPQCIHNWITKGVFSTKAGAEGVLISRADVEGYLSWTKQRRDHYAEMADLQKLLEAIVSKIQREKTRRSNLGQVAVELLTLTNELLTRGPETFAKGDEVHAHTPFESREELDKELMKAVACCLSKTSDFSVPCIRVLELLATIRVKARIDTVRNR